MQPPSHMLQRPAGWSQHLNSRYRKCARYEKISRGLCAETARLAPHTCIRSTPQHAPFCSVVCAPDATARLHTHARVPNVAPHTALAPAVSFAATASVASVAVSGASGVRSRLWPSPLRALSTYRAAGRTQHATQAQQGDHDVIQPLCGSAAQCLAACKGWRRVGS